MKGIGFTMKNPSADSATLARTMSPHVISCPPWGDPSIVQAEQTLVSEKLSFRTGRPLPDLDACSSQSTSQSFSEVPSVGETNQCKQGGDETYEKAEGLVESSLTMASQDLALAPPQTQMYIPCHHVDPSFGGLVTAAYGPQAMVPQSQMMGLCPDRVLLPFDVKRDDTIYVNAKQYHAILRRRLHRAKMVAQNKINKDRRQYLHKSRHLHALRRARGSGGRFLSLKEIQESTSSPTSNDQCIAKKNRLPPMSKASKSGTDGSTISFSYSDATTPSNSDNTIEQPSTGRSAFPPQIIGTDLDNFGAAIYGATLCHLMCRNER